MTVIVYHIRAGTINSHRLCAKVSRKKAKKNAEYIQKQLKEEQITDQMTRKEYVNLFTGSK